MLCGPGERLDDIRRSAGGGYGDQHVPRLRLRLELVGEDVLVSEVVRNGGDEFNVGAQADHSWSEIGTRSNAFDVIALEMIGDCSRPAVTAGEYGSTGSIRFGEQG